MECIRCTAVMNRFVDRADGSSSRLEGWRCLGCGSITRPIVTTAWAWWRAQAGRSRLAKSPRIADLRVVSNRVLRAIDRFEDDERRQVEAKRPAAPRHAGREGGPLLRLVPNRRRDSLKAAERMRAMDQLKAIARHRLAGESPLRLVRKHVDRRR